MYRILVVNAKGGCGKTTLATNIAGYYASRGHRVALADLDPQGSASDWLAARDPGRPPIQGIEAWRGEPLRPAAGTEFLVIDAPARCHGGELEGLLARADAALVPMLASPIDMRAAERFLDELMAARPVAKGALRVGVVRNRVREGTLIAAALDEYLETVRLPGGRRVPVVASLRSTQTYMQAAARGLSVFEFAPLSTLREREELRPLLRWLSAGRRRQLDQRR